MPAPDPAGPERLGVFGGTFDPPHVGHLAVARHCREALGLDRVLLVVANDPWLKGPERAVSPAEDRWAMVQAAAEGQEGIEPSRIEIDRGGPSYTVDTVEQLLAAAPARGRLVWVVVGADLVPQLDRWERVDDLRRLATLAVVGRPGSPVPAAPAGWRFTPVEGVAVDVSSSGVRAAAARGEPLDGLVPEAVIRCIAARDLYAMGR